MTAPAAPADDDLAYQAGVEEAARQEAIRQLEAAQAQELADRLAEAVRRSLAAVPAPQPAAPVVSAPPSADCYGVNSYAAYIYQRESGCNPGAVNGGGCRGIGQACPGSKLPCSDSDFGCQHAWFEGYALARYGSWEAAYNFWISAHWW